MEWEEAGFLCCVAEDEILYVLPIGYDIIVLPDASRVVEHVVIAPSFNVLQHHFISYYYSLLCRMQCRRLRPTVRGHTGPDDFDSLPCLSIDRTGHLVGINGQAIN